MSLSKRLLKHPRTQLILSYFLAGYIRLVMLTNRRKFYIHPEAEIFIRGEQNAIFAFWHGRMMLLPAVNPPRKMHVLISHHRDGKLISQVINHFGQDTIAGSSSKGGTEAVRSIVRLLKKGDNISITPDGPRGPNQIATIGIVTIAKLSKKPVLPVTFSATKYKRLKSWDKFMVAKPFGRIVFCVGAPIMVEQANEVARIAIETSLNNLVEQADAL
ncbi:MAG: lysophospholipid acyltransferase family protein [Rickettsiales bacterium]|jgi:lysophospholipid acyltransferase (LPLAT)-like uncharacterized protein